MLEAVRQAHLTQATPTVQQTQEMAATPRQLQTAQGKPVVAA
jgi:hypothetical protein